MASFSIFCTHQEPSLVQFRRHPPINLSVTPDESKRGVPAVFRFMIDTPKNDPPINKRSVMSLFLQGDLIPVFAGLRDITCVSSRFKNGRMSGGCSMH